MSTLQLLTIMEMILMLVPRAIASWTTVMGLIRRAKAGEDISQEELDDALGKVLLSAGGWESTPNPNADESPEPSGGDEPSGDELPPSVEGV